MNLALKESPFDLLLGTEEADMDSMTAGVIIAIALRYSLSSIPSIRFLPPA